MTRVELRRLSAVLGAGAVLFGVALAVAQGERDPRFFALGALASR